MIEQPPLTPTTDPADDTPAPALQWRLNRFGERVLDAVNGDMFDKLGARLTLQEAFQGQLQAPDTLYVIAGSDSGHLIAHVRQQEAPPGARYLFVEPPAVYAALQAAGVFDDLPAHIRCTHSDAWREEAKAMFLEEYLYIDGVQLVFSFAARSDHALEYVHLAWNLREALAALHWQVQARRGSEAYVACQLLNAADCVVSAAVWRQALPGRTGVLLAGGPSLDELLDWVAQHRDHLVLIAVSRISKRLRQVGIEPDYVVSVDPTELSYEISRDMLLFGDSVVFIHEYHVNPRLLAQWPYRSYYLGSVLPWKSALDPAQPVVSAAPTVTNTALEFAAALGLRRVILAGVDLCFTPEGHTHALGSNERLVGPRFDLTHLEVKTNDGRYATTTADYATAIEAMAVQVQRLQQNGIEVINPSPAAARIPGVVHQPVNDIALDNEALARPLHHPRADDTPTQRLRHARAVIREMERKRDEIARLEGELRNARRIVDKLFDSHGQIQNRNLRKRLDRLEREIDRQYPQTCALIRRCSTHAFLRALKSTQDVDALNAADVQAALSSYYETYLQGAARLRQLIERGIERARLRSQEFAGTKPLAELAPKWLADGEPGRFRRWLHNQAQLGAVLSEQDKQILAQLQQAWEADLSRENGKHLARVRSHADLRAAHVRMLQLFAQKKSDTLEGLIAGLQELPQSPERDAYLALAQGLLAESRGCIHEALPHYDRVLQSEVKALWPDALRQIASWALGAGHTEHARQALALLAELSPRYRPQYADFLAATGDLQGAIDVYERHLADHDGDVYAMARLARLLILSAAPEAAHPMLEHIERLPNGHEITAPLRRLLNKTSSVA